ncbi:MAG: PEP-CTERM sorting domain-containing protein, partial [Bacteroidales bacterium]|nr:PEP-CTERM sorting domain-containing protein [Bacteroidales bacterium]
VVYSWFDMMGDDPIAVGTGAVQSISLRFDIPFTSVSHVGQPLMDIFPLGGGINGYADLGFLDPNADEMEGSGRVSFGASDFTYQAVPEPGTAALVLLGIAMASAAVRRSLKKA